MSTLHPPRRQVPPHIADKRADDEPWDTVTKMIGTVRAIARRLETQFNELCDVPGRGLPVDSETMAEADEEPPPGSTAVRQLHHLGDRMNVLSGAGQACWRSRSPNPLVIRAHEQAFACGLGAIPRG